MRKILIALIVSGALLVLGGVILGYYYPIVGNIVGIIGWILIFCFFTFCPLHKNTSIFFDNILHKQNCRGISDITTIYSIRCIYYSIYEYL